MYLNGITCWNVTTCLYFVKMACLEKTKVTKQLTLLDFRSKKLKLAENDSDSDQEVEDKSLDEQDLSETERDNFLPTTTSTRQQDNHITVRYPSASTTIIINDLSDHCNVAQDQSFRVSPACTSESSASLTPCDIAQGLHQRLLNL